MNQAMSPPKLIILEGIPGSGKSSAGELVLGLLQRQDLAVRFWREGDFDHPADFVTWYLTGLAYGQTHPVAGWEGVIQFYAMRQKLEVDLLARLPLRSLVIEHVGQEWERCNAEIARFVAAYLAD